MKTQKKAFIRPILLALLWLSTSHILQAAVYTVSSADQFNDLNLSAGDVVIWQDGTYADQEFTFTGSGTSSNPITLTAETPGGVIFTGNSEVNIYGDYLIMEGFYWNGGEGSSDHVEFRRSGSNADFANNCTIRNCAFNNLFTQEPDKSRWIVLHGTNNVVENCSFVNKESAGALILVELSYAGSSTPGHTIRNNYFYNITPKDDFSTNSGDCEAIRIGVSSYQAVSAQVLVEGNYFQEADGENEIITNKSADNTFLRNTFRNCRGSLVLRHGAGAYIEGNFFLGEGKAKSGGIRVSDRDHVIINNYMQDLSNDGDIWNNGITLVGGGASSGGSSSGYQNVDNVLIAFNTIYNSDDPIYFNPRSSYDPTGTIAYNLVYSTNGDIVAGDISGTGSGMSYTGNIFGGSSIGISDGGITEGNANFSASGEVYKPSSSGIAANAAGSAYSSIVNEDIEGRTRPNSNIDVGAHEVSGGSGSAIYAPITDGDVGGSVGACFMNASGNTTGCSGSSESLSLSSLADFSSSSGSNTLSVSSNVSWSASDNASWISLSPTSGSGNGTITVSVSSNSSTSDRTGTITVSGGSLSRSVTVTQVGEEETVNVSSVSLSPSSATIAEGGAQQLSATVSPSNATNQDVSYSSSNNSIATVNSNGLVTGVSAGSVTITVTTNDGSYTDTSTITVVEVSGGTNLALNKTVTATGTADGANVPANIVDGDPAGSSRWSANGFPQSATIDLGAAFLLESTEIVCYNDRAYEYIIEVSNSASGPYTEIVDRTSNTTQGTASSPIVDVFSSVEARYVRITISGAASYTGSWVSLTEVRVFGESVDNTVNVTSVSLNPSSVSLSVGDTQQLSSSVSPSNASNPSVSYSSSNTSVATVSSSGLVTAQGAGSTTITVTTADGGFTDTSSINVTGSSSLPSPWQTTDVGGVSASGSASASGGVFSIQGSGADIWGTADEFRFVYQTLNGDGELIAQVNSISYTHPWAKAGVMIRETLDAGSKHAMTVVTPANGVSFQRRTADDGISYHTTISGQTAPQWLRIVRSGSTFTSYYSSNGSNWTEIGSISISMSSSALVGLCVTSHNDGTLTAASVDNVSLSSGSNETTVSSTASADTYIRGGSYASNSYDSSTDLWLKEPNNTSFKRRIFLAFDVSSISGTVTSATLQMTPTTIGSSADNVESEVYEADDWANGLVWNDNPGVNDLLDSYSGSYTSGSAISFDVTSWVAEAAQNGDEEVFLSIQSAGIDSGSDYVRFASIESGTASSRPQLTITYSSSSAREVSVNSIEERQNSLSPNISIYPVPVVEVLHIDGLKSGDVQSVEIIDLSGQVLASFQPENASDLSVDVSKLETGTYLLRIQTMNNGFSIQRFVK